MSLFKELNNDGLEESQDRLGGYSVLDSDIYTGTIKVAYAGSSKSGARNVTLIFDAGGREYRETIYITNKKKENFFLNKEDKTKKVPLPGFTLIDDICLIVSEKPLSEQEAEDKMVKVYDTELRQEVPKSVPVLSDLTGKTISLAIIKVLENKSEKSGENYVPTAETRETNSIEKVFHTESRMTVAEARNNLEKPAFWDAWVEKNKGKVRDKRTIKDGGGSPGRPGAPSRQNTPPQQGANQNAPAKSLFGNKKVS